MINRFERYALERLEKPEDTQDRTEESERWMRVKDVSAKLLLPAGGDVFNQDQMKAIQRYKIRMRYTDGVGPGMRISREDRVFYLETVTPEDSKRRHLVCSAREWQE